MPCTIFCLGRKWASMEVANASGGGGPIIIPLSTPTTRPFPLACHVASSHPRMSLGAAQPDLWERLRRCSCLLPATGLAALSAQSDLPSPTAGSFLDTLDRCAVPLPVYRNGRSRSGCVSSSVGLLRTAHLPATLGLCSRSVGSVIGLALKSRGTGQTRGASVECVG
jgi:hypothetical protein